MSEEEISPKNILLDEDKPKLSLLPFVVLCSMAFLSVTIGSLITKREISTEKKASIQLLNKKEAGKLFSSALMFLVGLYIVIKKFWKEYIQIIFDLYFGVTVVIVVTITFSDLIKRKFFKTWNIKYVYVFTAITISIPISLLHYFSKNWIVSDIVAILLSVATIDNTRIPSFVVASALLIAFFAYDIYFVFFSDIMVTVATSIKIPAKLLFPKNLDVLKRCAVSGINDSTKECPMSMLGLGDIVIPGMFVATIARMEAYLKKESGKKIVLVIPTLIAYVLAVISAMVCLVVFNSAQPVLLYIVPYMEITVFICLLIQGQLKEALNYDEEKINKTEQEKEEDVNTTNAIDEDEKKTEKAIEEPTSEK